MSPPIRVLIVDPDEQSTAQYLQALSGTGWRTQRTSGLIDALSLASHDSYDVAILDMSLSDSVGPEAWQYLKRASPQLLGIFTTRSATLYRSVNPSNEDVFAYLLKPFRTDALPQLITTALAYPRADLKAFRGEQWLAVHTTSEEPVYKHRVLLPARTVSSSLVVALLVALVLFAGSVGTVGAAQGTLPGDLLYPVKTSIEELQLAATLDPSAHIERLLAQGQVRLDEIDLLVAQQRYANLDAALAGLSDRNNRAISELQIAASQNTGLSALLRDRVETALSRAEVVLQALLARVPDPAKPAIAHALVVSQENRSNAEKAMSGGVGTGGDGINPGNPARPTMTPFGPPMTPPGQEKTPGPPMTPPGLDETPGPPGLDRTPGPPMTPPGQEKTPGPPMTPPGQQKTPGPPPRDQTVNSRKP